MLRQFAALIALTLAGCGNAGESARAPESGSDAVPARTAGPKAGQTPPRAGSSKVDALQILAFNCGEVDVADLTDYGYPGQSDLLTPTCWLVRHPKGNLLWQLGLPGILAGQPGMDSPPLSLYLDRSLTEQLADLALFPAEVDYVAISSSLFQNIGQADQFGGAVWLVTQAEQDRMFPSTGDAEQEIENGANAAFLEMKREIITGEHDVFDDGSVILVPAPGPTPGHMVLQVTLPESGPVMLAGNLYDRTEARGDRKVPAFHTDPEATLASMAMLESRAEQFGARIIIEAEPGDIDLLPKPPLALR